MRRPWRLGEMEMEISALPRRWTGDGGTDARMALCRFDCQLSCWGRCHMRCNALPVRRGISASFLDRVESPKGRGGRAGGDGGCGASETNCVGLGVRSPGSKAWLGPDIDKRATANSTLNIDTCRSLSRIHPLQRRFSPTLLPDQIKRALPEQKKTTSSPPGTWHTWWVVNVKVHSLSGRRAKRLDPARRHSSNLVRQARAWIGQGKGRKGARQRHGGWKCSPE